MKTAYKIWTVIAVLALSSLACRLASGEADRVATLPAIPTAAVAVPSGPAPVLDLSTAQDTLIRLYTTVNPGVVALRVLTEDGSVQGSGFVADGEGHIVTNYHVVEGEKDLEVAFPTGFKIRGQVIGTDLDSDLAIIQVKAPAEQLHPLPLGDSDQVSIGQTVVAIGNPFGLEGTMTLGIVSGLGRTLRSLHTTNDGGSFSVADVIQTDAAVNPGNSGGPLLNLKGEVIGVNESIISSNSQQVNSGVGFAVPVNIVRRVMPALIANGKYDYPYLGIVSANDLTLTLQEAAGLPQSSGVYVTGIISGGPAEKAGLQAGKEATSIRGLTKGGDLIVAIDGQPVRSYNDLIGYIVKKKSPGDKVVLTVLRGNQQLQLDLTLGKRPSS